MSDILKFIDHTVELEAKFLPRFPAGTSQHSLLRNRLRALQTARDLISGERKPTPEELKFALPRLESILRKLSKARDKYEADSKNYKRFDPAVGIMEKVRSAVLEVLDT